MFPLDYQNQIEVSGESDINDYQKRFLTKMSEELRAVEATGIQIQGNKLSYRVAFFRLVSNWNLLIPIDRGSVEVTSSANKIIISYFISFKRLVIIVTLLVSVFGVFFVQDAGLPVTKKILLLSAAWLWLAGANCLITLIRYSAFIKRIVSKAG